MVKRYVYIQSAHEMQDFKYKIHMYIIHFVHKHEIINLILRYKDFHLENIIFGIKVKVKVIDHVIFWKCALLK